MLVGDREVEQGTVTLRTRGNKDTKTYGLAEAAEFLAGECEIPGVASGV